MTKIINALDGYLAERVRAAISGKPILQKAKPRRAEPVKCYTSQFHSHNPRNNSHTVQLPIAFRTAEYNADHTPRMVKSKWAKEKKDAVWLALSVYLPSMRAGSVKLVRIEPREPSYVRLVHDDERAVRSFCERARAMVERSRVRHIEFVRIGQKKLDDDNLVSAFKAIRDATCSFLVWGVAAPNHVRAIGSADDKLKQRGLTWSYRQQQCEANPRLYGIRLILHCAPPT